MREKLSSRFGNDIDADQPAHPGRLISAFVIRFLESLISKLASSEIPIFYLVSVSKETGLSVALTKTPKTGFVTSRPIFSGLTNYSVFEALLVLLLDSGFYLQNGAISFLYL